MRSIARVRSLSQLPGKVAITCGLVRIEVHAIVDQVVINRSARIYRTIFVLVWVVGRDERQLLRHRHPNAVAAKGLLVTIEVFEALARHRVAVHGRVLLVAEGDAGAGDAFTAGFGALRADRALLAAFQLQKQCQSSSSFAVLSITLLSIAYLPLSASEAVSERKVSRKSFKQHVWRPHTSPSWISAP
jgi:hypothetical protein